MMSWWYERNPRERRLFAVTAAVVVVSGATLGGRAALQRLRDLDDRILQREVELENLQTQYVQRGVVEQRYEQIVTEHSSALTVEEIHDNLRREIYDLTRIQLPATKDKPSRPMTLVRIPTLREGRLTDEGEGYREYQVRFQIRPASPDLIFAFVQRIENSDQLLRIDEFEMGRPASGKQAGATFVITRTVLDDPERSTSRRESNAANADGRSRRASRVGAGDRS